MNPPASPSSAIRPAAAGASPGETRARGIQRATLVALAMALFTLVAKEGCSASRWPQRAG